MRPTPRALLVFAAGIPVSLVVALIDSGLWPLGLVWLGLALAGIVIDLLLVPGPGRVTVTLAPPAQLFAGESDEAVVTVATAPGGLAAPADLLLDVDDLLEPPGMVGGRVVPGRETESAIPLTPKRRGEARLVALWSRWQGPLGLVYRWKRQSVDIPVPIIPNIRAVRRAAIQFQHRDLVHGTKQQQDRGVGSEFDAMRDYVAGLDHRWIDWKQSARHRKLVCKAFRTERDHQIILAIDGGHLMREPIDGLPRLDHAINGGLMMAYFALRDGDRVGLISFDARTRNFHRPVAGVSGFGMLQRAMAAVDYRPEETNFTLGMAELMAKLDRRSLVVMMTEFVDTVTAALMVDNIARLARRHLVVFVTLRDPALDRMVDADPNSMARLSRAVVAEDFARDRAVVLERLRQVGVQTLDTTADRLNIDLLNRYVAIRERELV